MGRLSFCVPTQHPVELKFGEEFDTGLAAMPDPWHILAIPQVDHRRPKHFESHPQLSIPSALTPGRSFHDRPLSGLDHRPGEQLVDAAVEQIWGSPAPSRLACLPGLLRDAI